jgi:hypothetical protein
MFLAEISARTPSILTGFRGCRPCLQAKFKIVRQIIPIPRPSASLTVHYATLYSLSCCERR